MPTLLDMAEFNLLWRRLELGVKPLVLTAREFGDPLGQAQQADNVAWNALVERGVIDELGDVQRELEDALRVLSSPESAVDLRWAPAPGQEIRALAAARTARAALSVINDGEVRIEQISSTGFIEAALNLLGEVPAGPGHSVSLPSAVVNEAVRGAGSHTRASDMDAEFEEVLLDRGVRLADVRAVTAMVGGSRVSAGQLGAAVWDRWGGRSRSSWVLNVVDGQEGRYAVYERDGRITITPVDASQLRELVQQMVRFT